MLVALINTILPESHLVGLFYIYIYIYIIDCGCLKIYFRVCMQGKNRLKII